MPTWSEILSELQPNQRPGQSPDYDAVRRKYLAELHKYSKRDVILYASGWLQRADAPPDLVSISDEDMQAFMEVSHGLNNDKLDLILHSPGGSLEAAEAIVSYLRCRFSDIRVIVPQLAMSAATMIACAANKIVLGKHSFLSPTDPQIVLSTPLGVRSVPAQAILDQFDQARRECADPKKMSVWLSILSQYGPDLLVQCESALALSKELVKTWLKSYMFKEEKDTGSSKAEEISDWLAGHKNFKSHARHIPRTEVEKQGMAVYHLEEKQELQDLVLSVFHSTTQTFIGTPAVKIVENHNGRAFIKIQPAPIPQVGIAPTGPKH